MTNSQKYVAELLGTLAIVFVGTAAIVTTGGNVLLAALAFGLAWAGMWWVFGQVSGGHFNPAITIAAMVAKRINTKDVVPYLVVQVIGGILGAVLLMVVVRGAPGGLANAAMGMAAVTMGGWETTSILVLELLLTAFLALVWLAATEKTGAAGITGLGLGVGYIGMMVASLGITGSALNPARALGPALLANTGFTTLAIFWVAAIVGAVVGAALWTAVVVPARTGAPMTYTSEA